MKLFKNEKLKKFFIKHEIEFTIIAIFSVIFVPGFIHYGSERENYIKNYSKEDKIIFETYNENYEDKTDENSKRAEVVLLNGYETGLKSLFNFVSHMNGKIEKINGIDVKSIDLSGENIGKIKLSNEFSLLNDKIYRSLKEDRIYYTILLPNNKKTIYNVQERLNNYLNFGIEGLFKRWR